MLPKKERLSRQEFNRFFSLGRRTHSPSLQIVYTKHQNLHVSVVVSKKVAPSAVARNKMRRRVYDVVRHLRTETGLHGVFIILVKPGAARTYHTLRDEVRKHITDVIA